MGRKKIPGVKQADAGKTCDIDYMRLSPNNPRQAINRAWLDQLKAQIVEYGGVRKPLECVESPEDAESSLDVVDGGHRLAAVSELHVEYPDNEIYWRVPVIITRGNSLDQTLAAGTGDGLAFDLVDEVNWIKMVLRAGGTQAQIAATKGVSTGWVADRIKLIDCSEFTKAALRAGEITQGKAKQLAKKSDEAQAEALAAIREAKANGNKSAGKVAPKRPGVKPLRQMSERFEHAVGASNGHIEGFQLGIRFATGEVTAEQLSEQYGLEL